jgi:phage-related protein
MVVVHEFCKEEAVMADTRRMEEQASRIGEEVRETTQRMGREYQKAVERGFETASKTFSEANRGFQALAAEMTDFSKRRWDLSCMGATPPCAAFRRRGRSPGAVRSKGV